MAGGLFVGMNKAVMEQLNQVTQGQMKVYADGISILASGAITLFILWKGYQVVTGKIQTPVVDLVWDVSKMAIILMFINNIDGYLVAAISAIGGIKDGFSGGQNVWELLDSLWGKAQTLGDTLYTLGDVDFVNIKGAIGLGLVWAGAIITMIISMIVFMSAEITILLLSVTAPIFIFCLMFGFLRQMFNNWLQLIFSSILTMLFATLVIRVGMNYIDEKLAKAISVAAVSNIVTLGVQVLLAGIGSAFVIWLSSKFASQLAGVGVEGAMQGMASMGIGTAALGASRLSRPVRNGLEAIGQRAENNLTGGGGMSMSERHRKDAADMAKRIKAVTDRVRRENSG